MALFGRSKEAFFRELLSLGHGPDRRESNQQASLNLAKREPSKGSMKGKLKQAGWDNAFPAKLLTRLMR